MRKKSTLYLLIAVIILSLLTACGAVSNPVAASDQPIQISTPHTELADYIWDSTQTTYITLNGDSIVVDGVGAVAAGSQVTIVAAGTYSISGTLVDGQIIVDTNDAESVGLILNGINVNNSTSAPIYIANAENTVIVLADGTENYVSDGFSYVFANAEEDEPNAAIFSKDDLTIEGNGTLTVTGNYNDAIASKDGLIITGGTLFVNAVDDGIRGKDYLAVYGGQIAVNAQGDGLKSDNAEDATMGYIAVENGAISVLAGGDAIQAQTNVMIASGEFTIVSGGGSTNWVDEATSAKGIKASVNVTINGGTFTIDAADDAVHSNDSIMINNGTFSIATGDDGMHADGTLTINYGTIGIRTSYEGIEATDVIVNGGIIDIVASDDGINGAGGNDSSSSNPANGFRQDHFSGSQCTITINGGVITIAAAISGNGDGLDANGTIAISGGDMVIKIPSSYRDYSSIDYDTGFSLTGGSVRLLDANGTYTEVTEGNVSGMGGMGGPGGSPGGGPGGRK